MTTPTRWGILSTGTIARVFAEAIADSPRHRLTAVASRDPDRAQACAHELAEIFWANRAGFVAELVPPDEAMSRRYESGTIDSPGLSASISSGTVRVTV